MRSKLLRWVRSGAAAVVIVLGAVACDGGSDPATPPPPPPPTVTIQSVVISTAADSVLSGESVQLSVTVTDSNNQTVANPTVSWASSDASIASVDANGLVRGQGEGSATITATVSGVAGMTSMKVFIGAFEPTTNATLSGAVEFTDVNVPAGVTVTAASDLVLTARNSVTIDGELVGDCVGIEIASAGDVSVTGTVSGACSSGTLPGTSDGVVRILAAGTWSLDDADITSGGGIQISNVAADLVGAAAPAGWLATAMSQRTRAGDCHSKNTRLMGGFTSPDPSGGPDIRLTPDVWITCEGELFVQGGTMTAGSGLDGDDVSGSPVADGGDGESSGLLQLTGAYITVWMAPFTIKAGNGGKGGSALATGTDTSPSGRASAGGGDGGHSWLPQFRATAADGRVFVAADAKLRIEAGTPGKGGDALAIGIDGADATGATAAEQGGHSIAVAGDGGDVGVGDGTGALATTMFAAPSVQVIGATFVNPPSLANGGEGTAQGGNGGNGASGMPHGANGGVTQAAGGTAGRFHVDLPGGAMTRQAGTGGAVVLEAANGGNGFDGCSVGNLQAGGNGGGGGAVEGEPGADGPGGPVTAAVSLDNAGNGGQGGSGLTAGLGGSGGVDASAAGLKRVEKAGPNLTAGADGGLCETAMNTSVSVKEDAANHEATLRLVQLIKVATVVLLANDLMQINIAALTPLTGSLAPDLAINLATQATLAGFDNILVTLVGLLVVNEVNRIIGLTGVLTAGVNGGLFGVPVSYDVNSMVGAGSPGFDPAMFGLTAEQIEAGVAAGTIIRRNGSDSR